MKIEVTDDKVKITMFGVAKECVFGELVEQFKKANDLERRKLAVIHFDSIVFKTINKPHDKSSYRPNKKNLYWDDEAQNELDDILGADPYTMIY